MKILFTTIPTPTPRRRAGGAAGLLLAFWLLLGAAAHAQTACPTPPPAGCPEPFKVVDFGTRQELTTLQVGCRVSFVQNCGRNTPPANLYYQVLKGTNSTPASCLPTTQAGTFDYTPTAADIGPVTVFELANVLGAGTAYVRNYQVVAATPPAFTVAPCAGNTALITLTSPQYDQYTVQVNGGPAQALGRQPQQVAATLGASNTFVVTGLLTNSSCPQSTTQTVTLPAAQTPVLVRLTRAGTAATGGAAQVEVGQVAAGFSYALLLDAAGQPTVATVPVAAGTTTATVALDPAPAGRYLLRRTDACGNVVVSNALPTLGLSGTVGNNVNNLVFTPFDAAGISSYTLTRSDGAVIAPLPGTATGYADTNVRCGTVYTYRLTAVLASGGQSVSNLLLLTAQSTTPPPVPLLVPSFDLRNRVVLTARPGTGAFAAGGRVVISRQAGGAAPVAYAALSTNGAGATGRSLRDSTLLATLFAASPCYSATLRDTCGNTSAASAATCPALLTVAAADPEGQTAQLRWSAFRGPGSPAAPASYRVLTLAADGTVLATSAPTSALTYLDAAPPTDRQVLRYRVEASGAGLPAGTVSYSNVASLTRRPRLVVPTAFTPNADGLNDVLELKGRYLQTFTFIIVDRNGQEVFRTTDRAQTWDGTINGRAPVNAAYVWRLDLQDEEGQTLRQTGTVTILK